MRWVTRMLFAIVALAALVFGALLWMAGGVQSARTFEAPAEQLTGVEARTSTDTATLRVVVWNASWAYGWGSDGTGGAKPADHFEGALEKMGAVLAAAKPDLVLLQEIDLGAARSYDTHQARVLAKKAGLPWVAEAVSWEANYLPFPYWPPKNHFGRMRSGGAILSRFPITKNVVELYPKPEDNSWVYNLGYLFRYLQRAEIDLGGGAIAPVFNTHLDAFSASNRQAHAGHIARELAEEKSPLVLFGGDLNTVPPEATHRGPYPDEPDTVHDADATLPRLRTVEGLKETLPGDAYLAAEDEYFTFPAHAPNRKLDHLFAGAGYEVVSFRVMKEAGDVSDHLPILAELRRTAP